MMIFKKAIARRTFLRGAGTALALPFLDAMIPAFAASGGVTKPPLRVAYVYFPVGRIMKNWTPVAEGTNFELTPSLQPFAPYREQMLVLSGMDIKAAHLLPGEGGGGNHGRPCAAFLTGVHPYTDSLGISFDQIIAKHVGHNTPLASLQLGLDPPEWAAEAEVDYPGYYRSTVSWRNSTTPLPVEHNPRRVFERLFGDTDTLDPEAMRLRIKRQSSVLDSVSNRVNHLMGSVGASDRHKLEEYLDAVRDIERGIQVAESRTASGTGNGIDQENGVTRPSGIPETVMEHARLMADLMVLAYQGNMTQVVTFMTGHEGTNRNYTELGALDGHHSLSHHKGVARSIELVAEVDRYQSEMVAYFLQKMRSTPDVGDTTLLDNAIIMAGSGLSDGNLHLHTNVPVVVFGGAQSGFKGGRHLRYNSEPLSNLHLAILDRFGAPADEYFANETSDATGILKGLA